jgi:phosphoglycolate phosphatase-like HAD superfamily hydrolase
LKVVLFDIDGTLVRAGGAGRKALGLAAERLYGRPGLVDGLDLSGRTDAWICRQVFRRAKGRAPSVREFAELRETYLRLLPAMVRRSVAEGRYVLPAGVKALVRRLSKENGVLLGLGTGNFERGARIKLGPGGFNRYFAFGGFGCDGLDRCRILKTAARRARKLAPGEKLEVFVVGDTPHDVSAGRRADFTTIAVGTGFAPFKELAASKPDHLARDFRGMSRWLAWLGIAPRR